jgi:hypothetical protein
MRMRTSSHLPIKRDSAITVLKRERISNCQNSQRYVSMARFLRVKRP